MAKIAILGNYPPRRCGIATFTADLAESLQLAGATVEVIAMNDGDQSYAYPAIVAMAIRQDIIEDYAAAARYINHNGFDLVCVQHEYGIYGGMDGDYLLNFLRQVNQPVVTTLHTILGEPTGGQLSVVREIGRLSDRVVTMSRRGEKMLADIFHIPTSKIQFAFHGIPDGIQPPRAVPSAVNLLTFGLLSESKGIEYVIRAMPAMLAEHPQITYQIVGATHPQVRRHEGEAYRDHLESLVKDLGVETSVEFVDRFVSPDELRAYLFNADIYITPYLTKNQITSGTLAYAFGSGKAVISTPYWHAEELLENGAGILVPFRDEHAIAAAVNGLLEDRGRLVQMQSKGYGLGREMTWPSVGRSYVGLFESVIRQSATDLQELATQKAAEKAKAATWPPIDIRHLLVLTDDTGILQHATHDIPNRFEGYCVDDNARAAIVATELAKLDSYRDLGTTLTSRYLSFIQHAIEPRQAVVRNFMSHDRKWLEPQGSADSHGRTLWALGILANEGPSRGQRQIAKELFGMALPASEAFRDLRSIAFSLFGLTAMAKFDSGFKEAVADRAQILSDHFDRAASPGWCWFENHLAYDNARLSEAMLRAGRLLNDSRMTCIGLETLDWLCSVQRHESGVFFPIGSNGFYTQSLSRAAFDQQPLEVTATMDACAVALEITGDQRWRREIDRAFQWFLGENVLNASMVNEENGGGYDGLTAVGVNLNQGAESTLAWLSARLMMEGFRPSSSAAITIPAAI